MNKSSLQRFIRNELKLCTTDTERQVVEFIGKTDGIFIGNCFGRITATVKPENEKIFGVSWDKSRLQYKSRIYIKNKAVLIGSHKHKLDAAKSRWKAEVRFGHTGCFTTSSALSYIKNNDKQ